MIFDVQKIISRENFIQNVVRNERHEKNIENYVSRGMYCKIDSAQGLERVQNESKMLQIRCVLHGNPVWKI